MRFDFALAISRWIGGALAGVLAGLNGAGVDWRAVLAGILAAFLTDLHAWQRAREGE